MDECFVEFRVSFGRAIRIFFWIMASLVGFCALVLYIDPDKTHRERMRRERAEFYKRFVQDIKAAGLARKEEGAGELDKRPVITGKVATFLWAEKSGTFDTFESENTPDNPNTYADSNHYIPEDLHPKGDVSSVGTVIWLTVTYDKAGSYSNGVVAYRQMCAF